MFNNGLPLGVLEIKNPADEQADVQKAYKQDIPVLFQHNEVLAVTDGWNARIGTIPSDWERFMPSPLWQRWTTLGFELVRWSFSWLVQQRSSILPCLLGPT